MTGSQLKSFVPDAIREARQIARRQYAQNHSVADVFYEQARLLAGYEDDFEFTGSFSRYFPTYEDMSNEQLRGYFAWRTKVRHGQIEEGSLSFAYVYLYELINLVGVASAREAYDVMLAFGSAYRHFDTRFGKLFDAWLDDFVIYYGLDAGLLHTRSFAQRDDAFDVLLHHEEHSDGALFDALVTLGGYAIGESPFFLEHEPELRQLVAHGYRRAHEHHVKLKTTLPAKLSGRMKNERIWLFERAVFANPLAVEDAEYQISAHDMMYCRNGAWFRTRYENLEYPLAWVTHLLETCECVLRDAYAYPNTLERTLTTKYLVKAVEDQAAQMAEEARLRAQRAVSIDFSQLDRIRKAADETCEKLIVEEESDSIVNKSENQVPAMPRGDGAVAQTVLSSRESATGAFDSCGDAKLVPRETRFVHPSPRAMQPSLTSPLTPDETALIIHLLAGRNIKEYEREHACMASVLVDSINDKLYDEFADICIDASGGEPVIIEDYADELRSLLGID
ncbi:MAG: TerB N-terminal domain-containing protein [Coriobacteriales bacterium]